MLETLLIASPIFGIAIFGYASAKLKWVSENNSKVLNRFVFYFAVPLLLLRTFVNSDLPDVLPLDLLASFYIPIAILYFFGLFITAKLFRHDPSKRVITAMGSTFGNGVLLGVPILLSTVGEKGIVPYFIILAFHGLSIFTISTILLERGKQVAIDEFEGLPDQNNPKLKSIFKTLSSIGRNPILAGIVAGLLMNLLGWKLPYTFDKIAEIMSQAVTPCSLFALGATMSHYKLAGQVPAASVISFTKVIALPAMAYFLGTQVFTLDNTSLTAMMIFAAMPTGVSTYVFAEQYKTGISISTTTIMISTLISMITIPMIIFWVMV